MFENLSALEPHDPSDHLQAGYYQGTSEEYGNLSTSDALRLPLEAIEKGDVHGGLLGMRAEGTVAWMLNVTDFPHPTTPATIERADAAIDASLSETRAKLDPMPFSSAKAVAEYVYGEAQWASKKYLPTSRGKYLSPREQLINLAYAPVFALEARAFLDEPGDAASPPSVACVDEILRRVEVSWSRPREHIQELAFDFSTSHLWAARDLLNGSRTGGALEEALWSAYFVVQGKTLSAGWQPMTNASFQAAWATARDDTHTLVEAAWYVSAVTYWDTARAYATDDPRIKAMLPYSPEVEVGQRTAEFTLAANEARRLAYAGEGAACAAPLDAWV